MKIAPVDATMSFPIRMVRLRSFSIPALLFGLSLFFRVWNSDSDVFSDEAYYYYLTMFPEKYLTLHRNHPFLLYIVYHPFSQDLVTFRFVNILVGSLVPVLVYVLLASYNVRISLRIAGGVAAAINVILVRFSGIVFLDMLAVALLLLGCVFLRRGLWAFSGLTFGLSALVKEYALIAALILVAGVWFRTRSAKLTALCASGVGVAAVILAYIMFPMGGVNELIEGVARGQAIDQSEAIYLMLFALAGLTALFLRLYEESLIVIGYATVVLAGGFNLEWYLILPMPFLILCVVAVFDRVFAKLKHDTPSDTVLRHFAVRFRRPFVGMLVLFCLLTVSNPFATYSHLTDWHQHSLQGVTRFVQEEYPGGEITLIDCFWAYGLYPFGTAYSVSHHDFTGATGFDAGYFEHHVYETRLGVVCPGSQNAIRDSLLQRFSDFIVYNQEDFIVIAMRDGNSQERLRSDHNMIRLLCSNTC